MKYEIIRITDEKYPKRLLKIENPPQELYCVGNVNLLNKLNTLAIVGSRNCTNYGRESATYFAEELSRTRYLYSQWNGCRY